MGDNREKRDNFGNRTVDAKDENARRVSACIEVVEEVPGNRLLVVRDQNPGLPLSPDQDRGVLGPEGQVDRIADANGVDDVAPCAL